MNNLLTVAVCCVVAAAVSLILNKKSEQETVSFKNKPISIPAMEQQEVVCNEFGRVYYKCRVVTGGYSYTPVYSDTSFVVRCSEYEEFLKLKR